MSAIQPVLEAALQSTKDLCATAMGLEMTPVEKVDPPADSTTEVHRRVSIAVGSERVTLLLSIIAGVETCTRLAKALLGAEEDEEIDGQDVADGVSEMINIIAGGVKEQLNADYPSLKVGLPVWINGDPAEHCPRTALSETRPILIDGNLVQLRVMLAGSVMNLPFPEQEDIVELFTTLTMGKLKETKASKQTTLLGKAGWPFFAGLYQTDPVSAPAAAILLDPTLALAASGALSGFAPGVILEDLKAAVITGEIRSNVYEVLNIAGSLLNANLAPRVRLTHNGKPPPLAVRLEEVRPSRRAVLVDGLHQRTTTCELKETVIGE